MLWAYRDDPSYTIFELFTDPEEEIETNKGNKKKKIISFDQETGSICTSWLLFLFLFFFSSVKVLHFTV